MVVPVPRTSNLVDDVTASEVALPINTDPPPVINARFVVPPDAVADAVIGGRCTGFVLLKSAAHVDWVDVPFAPLVVTSNTFCRLEPAAVDVDESLRPSHRPNCSN